MKKQILGKQKRMLWLFFLLTIFPAIIFAQSTTYSGSYPINLLGFTEVVTTPITAGWAATTNSPTSANRTVCYTQADPNFNSGRNLTYRVPHCGTITLQMNGTAGRGFIVTVTTVAEATQLSRTVIAIPSSACYSPQIVVNYPDPVNISIVSPASAESPITGTGSSYLSSVNITSGPTCTAPEKFNVTGTTVICEGSTDVTLDGSEIGVTYELYRNNELVSDSEKSGTGNSISWTVDQSGNYTISSKADNGVCFLQMDGIAEVVIDNAGPEITSSNLSGATYTQFGVASELSVTANRATGYQWYSNSTANNSGGILISGATNASYAPSTTDIGAKYYYVVVTGPCGDPVISDVSDAIIVEEGPQCNELRLASDFVSGISSYTFETGDKLHGVNEAGASINLPNRNASNICGGAAYRVQLTYVVLEVKSKHVNSMTVIGTSSGTSVRNISKLEVGESFSGPYTELTDFNVVSNSINTTSCGELTIDKLNIPTNSFLRFTFSGNVNLSGFDICYNPPIPTISLTSGNNPATAMATVEMTPVVFTYTDVEDDNNVISNWYTDNTYASTTTAPGGLSISKDTEAKTVTVSGTPITVGTYYYKVSVNEEDGNAIEGSVVVDPYIISNVEINTLKGIVFDGATIRNITKELIHVLDMSGRIIVSSDKDINMSTFNKGIYIIRGKSGVIKIALTK